MVERCIQIVSDSCRQVYGFDARDGFIRSRIHHRQSIPQFQTKKDFKIL